MEGAPLQRDCFYKSRKVQQQTLHGLSSIIISPLWCVTFGTARKQAQDIYVPVILGVNLVYYLVKYLRGFWLESTLAEVALGVLFAAAYYLLYQQILDHAANRSAKDTSLIGGHWLDVLAVLAVIQYGTAFATWFYWLLLALPAWGAWSLYQTVMGKEGIMGSAGLTGGSLSTSAPTADDSSAVATNRKQRRAEQRNQRR